MARTGRVRIRFTDRADGDLRPTSTGVDARRRRVAPHPWSWAHQVHGARVLTVRAPGEHCGAEADAFVTDVAGAVLSVRTADCAPVALVADGAVGAVHAGWRGLVAGVVPAAVAELRRLAPGPVRAVLGPCIRPGCYEFTPADLDLAAAALGDGVRATTSTGAPALDLGAGVAASLLAAGVDELADEGGCTSCSGRHWSHRARGDDERQGLVVWMEPS